MPLRSQISSDLFLHIPGSSGDTHSNLRDQARRIIFFITGNPGLIGYYHTFLSLLADSVEGRGCVIFGASLGGFEVKATGERNRGDAGADVEELLFPRATEGRREGKSWGLREQVELCIARADGLVRRVREERSLDEHRADYPSKEARPTKVVLMGHSVGAWIALEMIRHKQAREEQLELAENDDGRGSSGLAYETGGEDPKLSSWEVEAAMLLTPTIMDLPLSTSGRIAGPLLGNIPYLPELAQWGSIGMKWLIGEQWLRQVVSSVTGMQEAEGSGLDTTVKFLLSDRGVQQSLFLARDELRIIREDAWGEEVWGVLDEEGTKIDKERGDGIAQLGVRKSPRLYFLFADKDHWVADETRRKIFKMRGRDNVGHRFVVDEEGLQHAWCLKQNAEVADRVKEWLQEINGSQT